MSVVERAEKEGQLPAPSAEFAVLRMFAQAMIRSMPKRRGERFIRELASIVANEEKVRELLPARPASQRAAHALAQEEAAQWIRQALPLLLSAVPPE